MATRYVRSPAVLWRRSLERVLVRPPDGDTVRLAGTGVDLWDALDEPRSLAEAAAVLAARYGVGSETVLADLGPAVDELVARGVVVAEPAECG